jgi:carbonic anhydrase
MDDLYLQGGAMKKMVSALILIAFLMGGTGYAGGDIHWGYTGDIGPEHWAELSEEFEMCAKGKNQSPINLTNFIEADLSPLEFNYQGSPTEILNNGHTIQINYPRGSKYTVHQKEFELWQFHFHAPSEHLIEGKSFPLEAHFVHFDKKGNLSAIAVMLVEGSENHLLKKLWEKMPLKKGDKHKLSAELNPLGLFPENKSYYLYNGSFTSPPCTEGGFWVIMKSPVSVSKQQVEMLMDVMHHPNNRPVQPVNARPVLK